MLRPPLARLLFVGVAQVDLDPVAEALAGIGHQVATAAAPEEALARLAAAPPALVVVRRGRGAGAGLDLLRRLRRDFPVPCVVLGDPRDGTAERVAALDSGAEDYLHDTMPEAEMLARIHAVLRRSGRAAPAEGPGAADPCALAGGWRLVPARRGLLAPDGRAVRLTSAEFELLRLLAAASGDPVGREAISRTVFRRPWRVEDRAIDGLVKRLRRRIGIDAIATVRGIGYALLPAGREGGEYGVLWHRANGCFRCVQPGVVKSCDWNLRLHSTER